MSETNRLLQSLTAKERKEVLSHATLVDLEQKTLISESSSRPQYVQHQMAHLGQTAACNRMHDAGPRFARWLLTVQDRSAREEFFLTQQFLAHILGTGRTTMNVLARHFERESLIGHNRGRITILDRKGLEAASCACYEATRGHLTDLYA